MRFKYTPLVISALMLSITPGARAFHLTNLAPEVVKTECHDHLTGAGRVVRLADEAEVVIAAWNVEGVRGKPGGATAVGVDPRTSAYVALDRRPDFAPAPWKFRAKQRKIQDAAALAGRPPGTLAHFVIAPEVENIDAAEELFNTGPLRGRYRTFLTTGNDARGGVDIAFAVRADLDVTIEMRTYRNARWYDPAENTTARLFTRDLPTLIVRDRVTKQIQLILIGQHAKAMRDRARGRDRASVDLRSAQLQASAEIVKALRTEFTADVPIVMAGDFNAEVRSAPELAPIKHVLTDAFDVVGTKERDTQTFHPSEDEVIASQLDACFVSPSVAKYVRRALVLPEFDHRTGERLASPRTRFERETRFASDHRAIAMVLDGRMFGPAAPAVPGR